MLKESYVEAVLLPFIMAIDAFVQTVFGFYQYVLFGIENLDEKATMPIRQLAKRDTFKFFTLSCSARSCPNLTCAFENYEGVQHLHHSQYFVVINLASGLNQRSSPDYVRESH